LIETIPASILTASEDALAAAKKEATALPCKMMRITRDEIVAAKPSAAFDAKWDGGPIYPDFFSRLVYERV
jgi:hypothetical protein